jgi:SAM-dependent methyltransferase
MKNAGIRVIGLLILQTLWLGTSHSAEPGSTLKTEEMSKQESIYRSQGEQRPEGYVIDRSLSMYMDALSADFDRTLASLGPKDRWMDIGAGMGQAILDYSTPVYDLTHLERRGKKAQVVAISIEDRRTAAWHKTAASLGGNQLQYLFNKRLREYSLEELGQFQLITDVIGGFSYVENLSLFMEKVLGFLGMNGSFYTVLQDVHSEAGTNKPYYAGAPYLTEIANADGSAVKVCSWLKSITCVEVTCELKSGWKPPIEVYRIRKFCNNVTVPSLVQTHFAAGTPPERKFQLKR